MTKHMAAFHTFSSGLDINLDHVVKAHRRGDGTVELLGHGDTPIATVTEHDWDRAMDSPSPAKEMGAVLKAFTERLSGIVGRIPTSVRMHY